MTQSNSGHSRCTTKLIRELEELRHRGDCLRTALYWNFQRLTKNRELARRATAYFHRKNRLRLHTDAA